MGNCVERETGLEYDEFNNHVNITIMQNKIRTMKTIWRARLAEKNNNVRRKESISKKKLDDSDLIDKEMDTSRLSELTSKKSYNGDSIKIYNAYKVFNEDMEHCSLDSQLRSRLSDCYNPYSYSRPGIKKITHVMPKLKMRNYEEAQEIMGN